MLQMIEREQLSNPDMGHWERVLQHECTGYTCSIKLGAAQVTPGLQQSFQALILMYMTILQHTN